MRRSRSIMDSSSYVHVVAVKVLAEQTHSIHPSICASQPIQSNEATNGNAREEEEEGDYDAIKAVIIDVDNAENLPRLIFLVVNSIPSRQEDRKREREEKESLLVTNHIRLFSLFLFLRGDVTAKDTHTHSNTSKDVQQQKFLLLKAATTSMVWLVVVVGSGR